MLNDRLEETALKTSERIRLLEKRVSELRVQNERLRRSRAASTAAIPEGIVGDMQALLRRMRKVEGLVTRVVEQAEPCQPRARGDSRSSTFGRPASRATCLETTDGTSSRGTSELVEALKDFSHIADQFLTQRLNRSSGKAQGKGPSRAGSTADGLSARTEIAK